MTSGAKFLASCLAFALLGVEPSGAVCPSCKCQLSTSGINFGSYNPVVPSSTQAVGSLSLSCSASASGTQTMSYSIALSSGAGSFLQRQMTQGSNTLAYNLFQDAAHTIVWGDGSGGSSVASGSMSVVDPQTQQGFSIYGEMPAQQAVASGSYSDVIITTISY